MRTIFASKAEVGKKYLTKNGMPVEVTAISEKNVVVFSLANGHKRLNLDPGAILRPYDSKQINPDARRALAHPAKDTTKAVTMRLAELKGKHQVKALYQGKEYTAEIKHDGFYFEGVRYISTTALATKITGHPTSGPTFFGLRKRGK